MRDICKSFIRQFKGWTLFEKTLLGVMLVMLLYTNYVWGSDIVGVICTIAGVLCVVLVAKGSMWNYFWGVINVVLYAYIAYKASYGGDFVLNAFYYLPMQFIGLYFWKKNPEAQVDDTVAVQKMTLRDMVITVVLLSVATYVIGRFMPVITDILGMGANPAPFVDAFTSAGSVLAMYLMVKRFKEQWLMWIVVNVLAIYMWLIIYNDYTMTIMWVAYLLNSIYGYYNWRRLER